MLFLEFSLRRHPAVGRLREPVRRERMPQDGSQTPGSRGRYGEGPETVHQVGIPSDLLPVSVIKDDSFRYHPASLSRKPMIMAPPTRGQSNSRWIISSIFDKLRGYEMSRRSVKGSHLSTLPYIRDFLPRRMLLPNTGIGLSGSCTRTWSSSIATGRPLWRRTSRYPPPPCSFPPFHFRTTSILVAQAVVSLLYQEDLSPNPPPRGGHCAQST